jgi:ABC-2 type transport system permease protein
VSAFVRAEIISRNRMIAGLAAGGFTLLLIVGLSYDSLGQGTLGAAFKGKLPTGITALSGSRNGNWLTPLGWMGFGFNHPLFLVLMLTAAISVGSAAIAGEVDSGRAELLFTSAVPRTSFLGWTVLVWLAVQLAVLAGAIAGALLGGALSDDIRAAGLAEVLYAPLQFLPVAAFVAACSFLGSAIADTRGAAMGIGVGVAVLGYLLNVISGLISQLDWLRWITPFGYYDPGTAITEGVDVGHAAVLLGASALLMVAARAQLLRRDLA